MHEMAYVKPTKGASSLTTAIVFRVQSRPSVQCLFEFQEGRSVQKSTSVTMAPKRSQAATTRTLSVLLLAMTLGVVEVAALGINCRGSGFCGGQGDAMVRLRDAISQDNDPGRLYSSGQQIACTDNNICAFVQNFGDQVAQSKIASLMPKLVDHGCKICGSVPLDFPNSNDVSEGELTVNFVSSKCFRKPASNVCI